MSSPRAISRFSPRSRKALVLAIEQLLEHSGKHPVHGEIGEWDVSHITDMAWLFSCKHGQDFNLPLNSWNVSNVTNMKGMFYGCNVFDQPLDNWNVSNVTDMSFMFSNCHVFNRPLDSWNVSNVTNMKKMCSGCRVFNRPLDSWNVSNVTNMAFMFSGCSAFRQDLPWELHPHVDVNGIFDGSDGRLVFVSDVDCEGQMDPISLETIPKERGFRLEAEAAENDIELQHGRCYDAESLIHVNSQIGPLTRKPFTINDKRRIEAYRRTRKSRSDDPIR
jgi:hypothetical protein